MMCADEEKLKKQIGMTEALAARSSEDVSCQIDSWTAV